MNVAVNIDISSRTMESLDLEGEEDFKSRLRSWCGLFVSIHHGKIYFLHQTPREFLQGLSSPATIPAKPERWQHSISTHQAHAVLMEIRRTYLILAVLESDGQFTSSEEVHQYLNGYAFLCYSAQYWTLHFRESKTQKTALPEPILETAATKDLSRTLNTLSTTLGDCYQRWGIMDALWIASGIAELAVSSMPQDHPGRAAMLNNLGRWLGRRFERTGVMNDLNRAVEVTNMAGEATPQGHLDRAERLDNLSTQRGSRFSRTGAMADLEEAISVARQAVDATPDNHPDRAERLNNLGIRLGDRFSRTGAMADLEEAIVVARQAVDTTSDDHPSRATLLNNFGGHLGNRYLRTGAMADLEEAIRVGREAIDATPLDHPDRAIFLSDLGGRLGNRYSLTNAMADLEEAKECFVAALRQSTSVVSVRISAGRQFLSSPAILQDQQAYAIAKTTINLIPLLTPRSLQNSDKRHLLSAAVGLSSDAAAIALHDNRGPAAAIELLETGRGVIAGALFEQSDLAALKRDHPDLARAFIDVRDQ